MLLFFVKSFPKVWVENYRKTSCHLYSPNSSFLVFLPVFTLSFLILSVHLILGFPLDRLTNSNQQYRETVDNSFINIFYQDLPEFRAPTSTTICLSIQIRENSFHVIFLHHFLVY